MTEHALRRVGVTGTDTGIGKTVVTAALAARARELGLKVAAMKPIESGMSHRLRPDGSVWRSDAERLADAAGAGDPLHLVRPIALEEALAPMVAAERARLDIDFEDLARKRDQLSSGRDLLLVEGAGGLLAPITRAFNFSQLFAQWQCELVIVAGNRIGVLNHVALTMRAAAEDGLLVRAIVLTALSDRDATLAEGTNYDALRQMFPAQPMYRFAWVDRVDEPDALAMAAAGAGLDALLLRGDREPPDPQSLLID